MGECLQEIQSAHIPNANRKQFDGAARLSHSSATSIRGTGLGAEMRRLLIPWLMLGLSAGCGQVARDAHWLTDPGVAGHAAYLLQSHQRGYIHLDPIQR